MKGQRSADLRAEQEAWLGSAQPGVDPQLCGSTKEFVESCPMTSCVDWQLQQALGKLHIKLEGSLKFQLCRVPVKNQKEQERCAIVMVRPNQKT